MTDTANTLHEAATYPQFTNLALGEGLFDQLMTTIDARLETQFKLQRIKGADYAKVYLGSMEAVLANSTQYLLGIMLIDEQRAKLVIEAGILELQEEKLQFEIDEILPLTKLLTQAQIDKIAAEISLMGKQETKIDKEILFLTAKINTEDANVNATAAGVVANSIIGRQMELLRAQKLGFAGDLEVKAAKLHADYDAVYQSVQEAPEASTLATNAINNIIGILQTVEKIKDDSYAGDAVFTPPTVFVPPP